MLKREFTIRLDEGVGSQDALRLLGSYFASTWEPKTNLLIDGELFLAHPQRIWYGKYWATARKLDVKHWRHREVSVRITSMDADLLVEVELPGWLFAWGPMFVLSRLFKKQMTRVIREHGQRVRESVVESCPFTKGDCVIYAPSKRGHDYTDGERLEIGREYLVEEIVQENYVRVAGYDHPGGAIWWTEFKKACD
jgi:hypothetical protein